MATRVALGFLLACWHAAITMVTRSNDIFDTFMDHILANYHWIDEPQALNDFLSTCDPGQFYAIDTEFERSRTFQMNPALLQVMVDGQAYLIDLMDQTMAPLPFKTMKKVILHSGSEDLCLWHQLTGAVPDGLFDTQVAAAVCGYGLHYSYQNLVQDMLGVELSKAESRSDWLKRPLSEAQVAYAIEDVAHLTAIKQGLSEQMESKGLMPFFQSLMRQQLEQVTVDSHMEKLFLKLVKSERMNLAEQKKLMALLQWREKQAINRNKPRNWILSPQQLAAVVRKVRSKSDLFYQGLHPRMVKIHADALINVLHGAEAMDESSLPKLVKLSSQQGEALKDMRTRLQQKTEQLNIDPALIVNVAGLKRMAYENKDLNSLPVWQALSG